jgi:branched-chain amino acid transport system substrate-binding protein
MTFGAVGGATGYEEFEAKFKEQFGDPIAYGPGSYDAAMIMLNAAKAVATVDSDGNLVIPKKALADMVRATPYDGITGHLEFDEKGDLKVVSLTVFQAQGDELVPLKVYNFGE